MLLSYRIYLGILPSAHVQDAFPAFLPFPVSLISTHYHDHHRHRIIARLIDEAQKLPPETAEFGQLLILAGLEFPSCRSFNLDYRELDGSK